MLLNSLLAAALTVSAPAPDNETEAEAQLLRLFEGTEDDAAEMEEARERMEQLREQPLNINKVGEEELLSVPGMDVETATQIVAHRKRYGQFRSVEELDMVRGMDDVKARFLATMLRVETVDTTKWYSLQRLAHDIRHSRHTVTLSATVPTYYRAGDKGGTTSGAQAMNRYAGTYLGDALKHSLRYTMNIGNNLQINFSGAKAAGEPFFSAGNSMGYDRYSYSIIARDLGIFHTVIAGKYRGQFGMGLVYNNSLSFGKQSMLTSLGRRTTYFAPHTSASDSRHMQGAAAMARLGRFDVAALFSTRYIDATLNDDGTIRTVQTSAAHRTAAERQRKNNAVQTAAALRIDYCPKENSAVEWRVGMSYLFTTFDRPLVPVANMESTSLQTADYRIMNPAGQRFWNAGVDYRLQVGPVTVMGETAVNENKAVATIHNVMLSLWKRLTLTAAGRIYPYRYHALYGSALGDNRNVSNERGMLVGAHWAPRRTFTVDAYTDIVRYPWKKYRVSAPSSAWDSSVMMTLQHKDWQFSMRYRMKQQQQDATTEIQNGETVKYLAVRTSHRLRLTVQNESGTISMRSNVEGIINEENSKGYVISHAVTWRPWRRCSVYGTVAYFNTDDYDSRIYNYERGMLYSMGGASYYGDGIRCALHLRCTVTPWMLAMVKVGSTRYFDRSVIGTGARRIYASSQTDIDLQLQVKL